LSAGTTVEIPGPGGAAYANYTQVVQTYYSRAWLDPDGVQDDSLSVYVEVVVARSGEVISDRILAESGVPSMDQSVREALRRVRASGLPEFPEEATDSRRTFRIRFNLKDKRLLG
jgi:TonB family protein